MMHHKTAVIAIVDSLFDAQNFAKEFEKKAGAFNYELVIAVKEPLPAMLKQPETFKLFHAPVEEMNMKYKIRNMARFLIKEECGLILFIDELPENFSEDWLRSRTAPFTVLRETDHMLMGLSGGEKIDVDEDISKLLLKRVRSFIHLNEEEFYRLCAEDRKIKNVEENGMCVSVQLWDCVGGYTVSSPFPQLEYCVRVSSLGRIIYNNKV